MIKKKTGLVLAYFSGTSKMDSRQCTRCTRKSRSRETLFGTVDTWLIWKLTRGEKFMTDVSNASRTLLLNIHTLEWDTELLELFNIPKAMLPEVTKAAFIMKQLQPFFQQNSNSRSCRRSTSSFIWSIMYKTRNGQKTLMEQVVLC
jgi:glycerol kinase